MNKYTAFLFIIVFGTSITNLHCSVTPLDSVDTDTKEERVEISLFTERVHKRQYFIGRLKKTIDFLFYLPNTPYNIGIQFITHLDDTVIFKHNAIKKLVNTMHQTKSLEPVLSLWTDFISYKYLDNDVFLEDFTKLILIISQKLWLYVLPRSPQTTSSENLDSFFEQALATSSVEQLEYIDVFIQKILQLKNNRQTKSTVLIVRPEKSFTESVSDRFYYVQRLRKPIGSLRIFAKHYDRFCCSSSNAESEIEVKLPFHHERIQECIQTMKLERSTKPLFLLWDEFAHYKYLNDKDFLAEFIKLVFIAYKNVVINCTQKRSTQEIIDQLIQLYEKVDSLPLEEILNAIDILAHELPAISEKYELNSDMPWRDWLRKYWWAPPLIAGTVAVRFLLTLKNLNKLNEWLNGMKEQPTA